MPDLPILSLGHADLFDGEALWNSYPEQGIGTGQVIFFEFQMDESFDQCSGGGLRQVDDAAACSVPTCRILQAAFPCERTVVADSPEIRHYANMPSSI